MDSLTQIVLGAAVGEAVLGKKIGNRAMLWGAIAGTIPDLDVVSNLWLTELQGLAAHRGITHSIFFAVVFGVIMGWFVHEMYKSSGHKWFAVIVRGIFMAAVGIGLIYLGTQGELVGQISLTSMAVVTFAGAYLFIRRRYFDRPILKPTATLREWILFFFLCFITHTILDCFTVYGTQLFAPFSDYRVAWNNISVADPSYTTPFLLCLIVASFFKKENPWRSRINWAGIIISSLYMCLTFINQSRVKQVFHNNLDAAGIQVNRSLVTPTIINNVLWYCVAETDSNLVFGRYSFFDPSKEMTLKFTNKNDHLIEGFEDNHSIKTLKWFSDNYYTLGINSDNKLMFSDMRYGPFDFSNLDDPNNYVFKFELEEIDGELVMMNEQGGPPPDSEEGFVGDLWKRIWGDTSIDH